MREHFFVLNDISFTILNVSCNSLSINALKSLLKTALSKASLLKYSLSFVHLTLLFIKWKIIKFTRHVCKCQRKADTFQIFVKKNN